MNRLQYLLVCLGEECGEQQQAASKCLRFGVDDFHPVQKVPNTECLKREMHDILAVYEMVCEELDISSEVDPALIDKKKNRVLEYMSVSRNLGIVEST